ncbi:MAG TPA: response regulator transcription factor [Streptosporangiaceae bacterium]|nr:response regulator transcription factor [Streptosporangiaceae bacterium]
MAVVLDDHVTRVGIGAMLEQTPVVRKVVSCRSAEEAINALADHPIDILVLPCIRPEPAVERLIRLVSSSGAKTLILLEDGDVDFIGRSMSMNPDGFLLRSSLTLDVLGDTIVRLVRGELPIPSSVTRRLLTKVHDRPEQPAHPAQAMLTGRERQTLELLAQGCSNKQIARRLGISENGAKRYVANVLAKLNCPNRTLAVAWALKSGLLSEA